MHCNLRGEGCQKVNDTTTDERAATLVPQRRQGAKNSFVAVVYFSAAYGYDAICYIVSNALGYRKALWVMSVFLFSISAALVFLHDRIVKRYAWDILGLAGLRGIARSGVVPKYGVCERTFLWSLKRGRLWLHVIGSCIVGPPVVTLLLRKKGSILSTIFYLTTGTFIAVGFWVTVMSGVGRLTWHQFVSPAIVSLTGGF